MQKEQLKKISLQKYKLCFQVTCTDISGAHRLSPVLSQVIHDTKNAKNFSMSKYDPKSCHVDGTEELVMHTGRLPKAAELEVFFYQGSSDNPDWKEIIPLTSKNVNQSGKVTVDIPKYSGPSTGVDQDIPVKFQLRRRDLSDKSEPQAFTYTSEGRREKRSIPPDEPQGGKRRKVTNSDKTVHRAVSTICQTATPDINVSQATNERFTSGQLNKYVPIQPRPAPSVQPASSFQLIRIPPHKNTQQVTPPQVCHLSLISPTVELRSQQQQSSMNREPTLSAPLQLIQAGVDNSVYNSSTVTEEQHNMTAAASVTSVTSVTSQISQGLYSGSSSSIQDSSPALSPDQDVLLNDILEWGSEVDYIPMALEATTDDGEVDYIPMALEATTDDGEVDCISMALEATTDDSEVDYIPMALEATTDDSEVDCISMGLEATTDDSEVDCISMGLEATTDDKKTDECIKFFEDDLDAMFTDEETS